MFLLIFPLAQSLPGEIPRSLKTCHVFVYYFVTSWVLSIWKDIQCTHDSQRVLAGWYHTDLPEFANEGKYLFLSLSTWWDNPRFQRQNKWGENPCPQDSYNMLYNAIIKATRMKPNTYWTIGVNTLSFRSQSSLDCFLKNPKDIKVTVFILDYIPFFLKSRYLS